MTQEDQGAPFGSGYSAEPEPVPVSAVPASIPDAVVFLDFDGVISTPRAHFAHHDVAERDVRWIDPIACKLIARLQREHGFRLVISSTWRGFGRDRCAAVLSPYGLATCLHDDWATNHWPDGSRPAEIDDWLERNGRPPYAIFDDDGFAWTEEQRSRWVQSCCYNGFQLHNFDEAQRLFGRLAQVGRNPEGGDPQGLRAEHEHAVAAGDAPKEPRP